MHETCRVLWKNKCWIFDASSWLFNTKVITMHGHLNIKKKSYFLSVPCVSGIVCLVLMLIQVCITLLYKQQNRLKIWWMLFIIHSFSSLSDNRSKAYSKTMPLHSAIQRFLLQMRVSSPVLKSSSSFLRLLPRLLVTSISPFIFPSITCFRRQFLRKMWPIKLAFVLLFHVGYVGHLYKYFCFIVCFELIFVACLTDKKSPNQRSNAFITRI